jgi:hypothetical protein
MKTVWTWILAFSGVCVSGVAAAESADCKRDAEAFVNGPNGKKLAAASYVGGVAAAEPLRIERPCTAGQCAMAYFSAQAQAIALPEGYAPMRLDGTPAKLEWRPLPRVRGSQCENLVLLVVGPSPTATTAATGAIPVPAAPPGKPTATEEQVITGRFRSGGLKEALSAFHDGRQVAALRPAIGEAHGLNEAAAETLQILGQIVADRASAEAYRLLKLRLEKLLHCDPEAAPATAPVAPAAGRRTFPIPTFPETCKVLRPLRMEDIATSRDALLGAVSADGLSYLEAVQDSLSPREKQVEEVGAAILVSAIVVPLIVRPKLLADDSRARALVGALEALVDKHWDDVKWQQDKARRALAAGVLAYTRCAYEVSDKPGTTVEDCNFAAYADAYAGAELDTQIAARALTAQLISVATLAGPQGQPDVVQRVLHAVDAVFASSCMLAAPVSTSAPIEFRCPSPPDRIDVDKPLAPTTWLAFAQPIIDAALERDSNALLASIAHALEVFASAEYAQDHKRAFLLLGSLLQYSATYAAQSSANTEQLHEQRTKILESLTRAMSDRTARDGEGIWSFGGSLRLVAGVRVGATKPAVLSPLGLPLGVGFDHVASGNAAGFHLEFSPIDLGQYVAYDNRATVKTPELADAVSPSVTAGVGWGRSLPLVLGATFGYSPAFQLNPERNTRGVFNAGVTLGIYVPLIDMN